MRLGSTCLLDGSKPTNRSSWRASLAAPSGDYRSSRGLRRLRYSGWTWFTSMPAAMTGRMVSMMLCCFRPPNSRAQREVTVREVAVDSDRFSYSNHSTFWSAAPCTAAHPYICDPSRRSRAPPKNGGLSACSAWPCRTLPRSTRRRLLSLNQPLARGDLAFAPGNVTYRKSEGWQEQAQGVALHENEQ